MLSFTDEQLGQIADNLLDQAVREQSPNGSAWVHMFAAARKRLTFNGSLYMLVVDFPESHPVEVSDIDQIARFFRACAPTIDAVSYEMGQVVSRVRLTMGVRTDEILRAVKWLGHTETDDE